MTWHSKALGAVILVLALAQPVAAQEKAVTLSVRGGGFNALTSLDEPATADFKGTGYNLGGTVGVDLSRLVALRGDFTYARNELRLNDADTGSEMSRLFYDAAVQLRYPSAAGWTPYAFVGAGGVTLHPVGSDDLDETKLAGTVGLGLEYAIPGSNFGVGVEGKGWLYELSGMDGPLSSFDRTQFEVTWSAGVSYRIPFARSALGGR